MIGLEGPIQEKALGGFRAHSTHQPCPHVVGPGRGMWDRTIKQIIENEKPQNPISDDEIVEMLKTTGINVARRTVAKYRKIQNIPASFMRKRQSTLAGRL